MSGIIRQPNHDATYASLLTVGLGSSAAAARLGPSGNAGSVTPGQPKAHDSALVSLETLQLQIPLAWQTPIIKSPDSPRNCSSSTLVVFIRLNSPGLVWLSVTFLLQSSRT